MTCNRSDPVRSPRVLRSCAPLSFGLSAVWSCWCQLFFCYDGVDPPRYAGRRFRVPACSRIPGALFFEWLFLVLLYVFISQLSACTGWPRCLQASSATCRDRHLFLLEMRGEPFLPWDITRWGLCRRGRQGGAGHTAHDAVDACNFPRAFGSELLFCVCPIEKRRAGAGASAARRFRAFCGACWCSAYT